LATPPHRVLVVTSPPTPYRVPVFSRIARDPAIDLRVLFCAEGEATRPWDLSERFDFEHEVLTGLEIAVGREDRHAWFVNPGVLRALRRARYGVAVVWGWWQFASLVAARHARWTRRPYVVFSETHAPLSRSGPRRWARTRLATSVVRGASAWLATGTLSTRHLVSLGADEAGVFPFPNAPDVEALEARARAARPGRDAIRASYGVRPDAPLALFVGRFVEKKGLRPLLAAFPRVAERVPAARLLLVGDGPSAEEVRRLAAPLGDRVVFAGFAQPDRVHEAYVAADVLVLPSLDEPWGVVVNEAMVCGLPVVVSDAVGAAHDLVRPGATGWVAPAGDETALAGALGDALGDLPRARTMGATARDVARRWDHALAASSFRAAVERALARGPAR
jgi:glycosyltransferase involved in cell wall biosynthesis